MATVSKFANAHTTITTGYTNSSNAFADDGTNATAAPAKNAEVSAYFGFAAFSTSDIPDSSTINSVQVDIEFLVSVNTSVAEQFAQVFVNTTGVGSEQQDLSEPLSATVLSHNVTSGVTLTDLRSADVVRCRSRSRRGNSSTAVTFSIDFVRITVDYTAPAPEVPPPIVAVARRIPEPRDYFF